MCNSYAEYILKDRHRAHTTSLIYFVGQNNDYFCELLLLLWPMNNYHSVTDLWKLHPCPKTCKGHLIRRIKWFANGCSGIHTDNNKCTPFTVIVLLQIEKLKQLWCTKYLIFRSLRNPKQISLTIYQMNENIYYWIYYVKTYKPIKDVLHITLHNILISICNQYTMQSTLYMFGLPKA